MKHLTQKLFAVLFLILVGVALIYPLFQSIGISIHKSAVFNTIAHNCSTETVLCFSNTEWSKLKNKKEFSLKGKLFDVKRIVKKSDQVLAIGYYDNIEQELLHELKDMLEHNKKVDITLSFCLAYFEKPQQILFKKPLLHYEQDTSFFYKPVSLANGYSSNAFRPPIV